MSLATMDIARQAPPVAPPVEIPMGNSNFFISALRRWPLLLLGMICGGGLGYLAYTTQPPVYNSEAQVQVTKKVTASTDSRGGFFEDYISGQIDRIKSDRILISALYAREDLKNPLPPNSNKKKNPKLELLKNKLPEDDHSAAQVLKGGLLVSRSKESAVGVAGLSPVLNLSFKALDPEDCQHILEAVIDAYIDDITKTYSKETKDKLRVIEINTEQSEKAKKLAREKYGIARQARDQITTEDEASLRARISTNKGLLTKYDSERREYERFLKQIAAVGPNRTQRLELLSAFGLSQELGRDTSQNNPDIQIRILQAQKKGLLEKGLGKDHPDVKGLDVQIAFYTELLNKQNPNREKGESDELSRVELGFKSRLETANANYIKTGSDIEEDEKKVRDSSSKTTEMILQQNTIDDLTKNLTVLEQEKNKITSSETLGGFNADINNPPQRGAKVAPVLMQWLALGCAVGLVLGLGLSILVEMSDKSFRSPAEIRQRLGVPVLGHSPFIRTDLPTEADVPAGYSETLVAARRPKSIEAEAYRGVRTQLSVITANSGHQVIQITSPNPGDGKSTFAANLAISIAQSGKKIVLLDCDFRKPRVHKLFDIAKPELGLASVTGGLATLTQAIRHSSVDNLDILPCGHRPANPAELLSGPRFQQVLADLRNQYDYVIVDTPPMLAVSDPRIVAQRVDGVILVFKITKRARPLAERAREQLGDMGANVLGVIVNGSGKQGENYGYSYGYNYAYSYEYEYAETYADHDEADVELTPAPTKRKRK